MPIIQKTSKSNREYDVEIPTGINIWEGEPGKLTKKSRVAKKYIPVAKRRSKETNEYKRLSSKHRSRVKHDLFLSKELDTYSELLGCTVREARDYFETLFTGGVGWNNHGVVWEIDHIIPLRYFDLTDPEQEKVASRITNLQPLLIADHTRKTRSER